MMTTTMAWGRKSTTTTIIRRATRKILSRGSTKRCLTLSPSWTRKCASRLAKW